MIKFFHGNIHSPYDGCHWCRIVGIIDSKGNIEFAVPIEETRYKDWTAQEVFDSLTDTVVMPLDKAKKRLDEGEGSFSKNYIQEWTVPGHWEWLLNLLINTEELDSEGEPVHLGCLFCRCGEDMAQDSWAIEGSRIEASQYLNSEMYGGGGIHICTGEPICEDCYHQMHCGYCGSEVDHPEAEEVYSPQFYDEESGEEWCECCEDKIDKDIVARFKTKLEQQEEKV